MNLRSKIELLSYKEINSEEIELTFKITILHKDIEKAVDVYTERFEVTENFKNMTSGLSDDEIFKFIGDYIC